MPVLQHFEGGFKFEQRWVRSEAAPALAAAAKAHQVIVDLDPLPATPDIAETRPPGHTLVSISGHFQNIARLFNDTDLALKESA